MINGCNGFRAPGYWRNETSGILAPAVIAYLNGEELNDSQVVAIRAYLRQWITADVWEGADELVAAVDRIESKRDIDRWLSQAEALCIDPL